MNQPIPKHKSMFVGLLVGAGIISLAAGMMGQASKPVRSEPQYFVTADGDGAHLWVREGAVLRAVGHGECKDCKANGHDEHGDHDH